MLGNSIVWTIYMSRVKLYLEKRPFVIIVLALPFLPLTADIRKAMCWWKTQDTSGYECHCIGFVLSSYSSACISVALSDITQWVYSSEMISNLFR